MEDLLPYYERELAFLRRHGREFSERYPKVAGQLQMSGDVSEDPHVERLIESFAFLSARVSKKIEDDYPEFTDTLLDILYPHFLRPFPACSIAQFAADGPSNQLSSVKTIDRGTELRSHPVEGVPCRFRTGYPVHLAPLALSNARYLPVARPPEHCRLPRDSGGQISIELTLTGDQTRFADLQLPALRVYLDAEPSLAAVLADALSIHAVAAYIESGDQPGWEKLAGIPVKLAGYDPSEGLVEYPSHAHPAFGILSEFLAFPEKFNFVDMDWQQLRRHASIDCNRLTLHLVLKNVTAESEASRLLENLQATNLKLHCSPVVNLFRKRGEPIRLDQRRSSYPVVADHRHAASHELFAIESLHRVRREPGSQSINEFRPLFGLHHGQQPRSEGYYWTLHRDELLARTSPGYEVEVSLVDIDFNPALVQTDTLALNLLCSNRDLPENLSHGSDGGDLFADGLGHAGKTKLLRKPSRSRRAPISGRRRWQLASHLALDHMSLAEGGADGLRELLQLYDRSESPATRVLIESITGLDYRGATAWLQRGKHRALARGMELTLTVNEQNLAGNSLQIFIKVLEHFLGFYAPANSFIELAVRSQDSGQELARCPPRSSNKSLL